MACLFKHKWEGCKCSKCGETRDEEHQWNGCKCIKCGNTRDKEHQFVQEGGCDVVCSVCDKKTQRHKVEGGICTVCGGRFVPISELKEEIGLLNYSTILLEAASEHLLAKGQKEQSETYKALAITCRLILEGNEVIRDGECYTPDAMRMVAAALDACIKNYGGDELREKMRKKILRLLGDAE